MHIERGSFYAYTRDTQLYVLQYTTRIEIKFGHDPSTFTREQTRNPYSAHQSSRSWRIQDTKNKVKTIVMKFDYS